MTMLGQSPFTADASWVAPTCPNSGGSTGWRAFAAVHNKAIAIPEWS